MLFKIVLSKYRSIRKCMKSQEGFTSLMTHSLSPLDNQEQLYTISLSDNHEEILLTDQNKHELGEEARVCRICYSTGDVHSLIAPCECSGTMGLLHQHCLEQWLEISNTNKCEICQREYEIMRIPKSLFYFLRNPLHPSDVRYLINDVIIFIFLTTIISWLIIMTAVTFQMKKLFIDDISNIILPFSILFIYFVWCWVSFRYHLQVIKEWRSINQLIHVITNKDNSSLSRWDVEQPASFLPTLPNENSEHRMTNSQENLLSEMSVIK